MAWQSLQYCEPLGAVFENPVPLLGTMAAELDRLLECVDVKRCGLVISFDLCDVVVKLSDKTSSAQIGHEFRALLKAHSLHALAQRRPREFQGCERGLQLEWVRKAAMASLSPAQATAFRKFCTGSFLCHEREARHAQKAAVSPLCSLCGCLDTMTHI
eukprot:6458553-Amphidinium_carterae.1